VSLSLLLLISLSIWRVRSGVQAQEIYPELDVLESLVTGDEGKTVGQGGPTLVTQVPPPPPLQPGEPPQRRAQPFPPRMPNMMGRPLMMMPPTPSAIVVKNDNVFVLRGNQIYRLRASDLRIEAERTLVPGPRRTRLRIERFGDRRPEGGPERAPLPTPPTPPGPMPFGPPPPVSLVVEGNNVFVLLGDQIFRLRANDLEIQAQQTLGPALPEQRRAFIERQREGRVEREERREEGRPEQ
jgi:hypothetical protein